MFINYFCAKFIKMSYIQNLEKNLLITRKSLVSHSLYSKLDSKQKLIDFMENHVFAVWDFMSLIKALQKNLTCVDVPWFQMKIDLLEDL
jgi:hypothetical protein